MNVCLLAPEFLPSIGGVGVYIGELVRHMPNDINIVIVTPSRRTAGFRLEERVGKRKNIKVIEISIAREKFFYNLFFQAACLRKLWEIIRGEKIDLIHTHTAHMPDIFWSLVNRDTPPIVCTVHTTIREQFDGAMAVGNLSLLDTSERMTVLLYPFLRILEDLYFSKDRHYITVSRWMKEVIGRRYNKDVKVVYNAVDTETFVPAEKKEEKSVIFTGRLTAVKGVYNFIRAVPMILEKHPHTKFHFVGGGEERALGTIRRTKNCHALGYVSCKNLVEYYRNAWVMVAPSYCDNMPTRILEAMACGTPVVATDVGGIAEVVDESTGMVIKKNEPKEIADAVSYLLDNEGLVRKMGDNARRRIEEKFSWKENIKSIVEVYRDCL